MSTNRIVRQIMALAIEILVFTASIAVIMSMPSEIIASTGYNNDNGAIDPELKVINGVASGDVTSHSAIVWSRANSPATMNVQYSTNASFSQSQVKSETVNSTTDFIGHIKLDMLETNTIYHYKIWFSTFNKNLQREGQTNKSSLQINGTFKTAPDPSDSEPITFAMGGDLGCQQNSTQDPLNHTIFSSIKALSPDFFIFDGDQIYPDIDCPAVSPAINDPSVNWSNYSQVYDIYLKRWEYNRADPNLQSLLRSSSMYSQADDHEVINNYAPSSYYSNTTKDREGFPNLVKAGHEAFFAFSPIDRNSEDPDRIYRSFNWGKNMDLFIVDQHSYRTRNDLPDTPANNKTLLGKAQLQWLEQGLLNSNATWKIVSLDVPITIPSCEHNETVTSPLGCDNFATDGNTTLTFTRERNELLRFLDDQSIKNVVFLVTDMHFAGNIRVNQDFNNDGKNLTFYELINGPLSAEALQPVKLDPTLDAMYLYKEGNLFNFGYFKVQRQDSDGKVHFISEVRDVNGQPRPGSRLDLVPQ